MAVWGVVQAVIGDEILQATLSHLRPFEGGLKSSGVHRLILPGLLH